jgi:hypothetical protein
MSFRLLSTFLLAFAGLWVVLPSFLDSPRFVVFAPAAPPVRTPMRRTRRLLRRGSSDSPDH